MNKQATDTSKKMSVSVVIPSFNEVKTLPVIVERTCNVLKKAGFSCKVIVADDGSSDNSCLNAQKLGAYVVRNRERMGKGVALRRGFDVCKGDIIVTMDADGSHQPEEIPHLLKPILNGSCDAVFGSRVLNVENPPITEFHFLGNRLFNFLIFLTTGKRFSDSQCGFRVFKASLVKGVKFSSKRFEIETEMLMSVVKRRRRFVEIPITCVDPGRMSRVNSFRDGFLIILKIFTSALKFW